MTWHRFRRLVILLLVSFPSGCANPGTGVPDASPVEDACVPGCHWDCFGGIECWYGGLWLKPHAPYPCCTPGDPWPEEGPECASMEALRCEQGCGYELVDERYAYCIDPLTFDSADGYSDFEENLSLLRLFCGENGARRAGDPCVTEEDCRPVAADDASRLACEESAGTCAPAPRPEAPPELGASCGLVPTDLWVPGEGVTSTGACDTCHFQLDEGADCVRQACTVHCLYDEDCPSGFSCVCVVEPQGYSNRWYHGRVCSRGPGRDTAAGRTAWLSCP